MSTPAPAAVSAVPSKRNNLASAILKLRAQRKVDQSLSEQCNENALYIKELEKLLIEHNIPLPTRKAIVASISSTTDPTTKHILKDGTYAEIKTMIEEFERLHRKFTITVSFRDLGFWTMMPKGGIDTVGSTLIKCICGAGPMNRVDVLKGISGRLLPGQTTLLLGPPGSGKSTFLKALCGRLRLGKLKKEGEVFYNEEPITSEKFLTPKIAEYIEQGDTHAATMTVEETLAYAWKSTTGGHHSYMFALNDEAAAEINQGDEKLSKVQNIMKALGLYGVKNTYVGDAAIRGISGGQKRRVTLGEMVVTPRQVKLMDCISNGLDSATTYDIIRSASTVCRITHTTFIIALLQPPPEVFDLFDEIMLLSEGQVLFQGPRAEVKPYFYSLGYTCPDNMDIADFLQIIPTSEGKYYLKDSPNQPADSLKASHEEAQEIKKVETNKNTTKTATDVADILLKDNKNTIEEGKVNEAEERKEGSETQLVKSSSIHDNDINSSEESKSNESNGSGVTKQKSIDETTANSSHLDKSADTDNNDVDTVKVDHSRNQIITFETHSTDTLVAAWKASILFQQMMQEIDSGNTIHSESERVFHSASHADMTSLGGIPGSTSPCAPEYMNDKENHSATHASGRQSNQVPNPYTDTVIKNAAHPCMQIQEWPADLKEYYPGTWYYHFRLTLYRQYLITIRDKSFIFARLFQNILIGGIAGSLFSNIATENIQSMMGFLFFGSLYGALAAFAMIPGIFAQKGVYTKQADALFFPTGAFTLSQAVVFYPLQILECIIFGSIMYWSAGLSAEAGRFLGYLLINLTSSLCITQLFRTMAYSLPNQELTMPIGGIVIVMMVLFSGFILPPAEIPDWWIWFYYINPTAYALKAVVVNEYTSSRYDFDFCVAYSSPTTCVSYQRFGNFVLEAYGYPTEYEWVWYSFAILIAFYMFLFLVSTVSLKYIHNETPPQPPLAVDKEKELRALEASKSADIHKTELPFESVTFAFKEISYTVITPEKEEIELLRNVSGYFEPGTVTALMGSSGAGKTTLLDVLSGRKTTGTIKGEMCINGKPKDQKHFQRIMAYVEQFDSLSPHDTAREAIEFSAALRLPSTVNKHDRDQWVDTILTMLELTPIEKMMVGKIENGGMSFEQKKRVSIGMELAANPAILFLDEPTTGLDSRAAQIVTRSIRRVASSGRSVVCTIHQPSYPIFSSFDSLLLLKRGGQTVFFGELGERCINLIDFFQSAPNVAPIHDNQNPATWMLEVMGNNSADFHVYYKESSLCLTNTIYTEELCKESLQNSEHDNNNNMSNHNMNKHNNNNEKELGNVDGNNIVTAVPITGIKRQNSQSSVALAAPCEIDLFGHQNDSLYQTSWWHQYNWVSSKIRTSYWRTPSYNFGRMMISIIIAFIFSSAYPNQSYTTQTGILARMGVIYVTLLFLGVVGMQTIMPVIAGELGAFYREQMSNMYSPIIYSLCSLTVEIPYVILSSLCFVLPFFFFVGFQNVGNTAAKFGYYWLFISLYNMTLINLGQFLISATPSQQAAGVFAGILSTMFSLFAGFMIVPAEIPTFWQFVYWLNPLHYALQGLLFTQFRGDTTEVTQLDGTVVTAEEFLNNFYTTWSYEQVGSCVLALFLFIIGFRILSTLALTFLRFDKR